MKLTPEQELGLAAAMGRMKAGTAATGDYLLALTVGSHQMLDRIEALEAEVKDLRRKAALGMSVIGRPDA